MNYMAKLIIDANFRNYLHSAYPVDSALIDRLVEDFGEYFSRTVQDFIIERHRQLHEHGVRNSEIYATIQSELKGRRFVGPEMTVRQIRRVIYG